VACGLIDGKEPNRDSGAIYFTDHCFRISPSGLDLITGKSLCHEVSQEVSSPGNRFQPLDSRMSAGCDRWLISPEISDNEQNGTWRVKTKGNAGFLVICI
jgi:hypothetical protein